MNRTGFVEGKGENIGEDGRRKSLTRKMITLMITQSYKISLRFVPF